jgi:DNA helicase-2/ATP-dependent DNA helicase PcrA
MDLLKDLNKEQLMAAMHVEGPLLVLAGAGSGKTRVVAYRIAYLIDQGISPSEILAVTFTNKAAGEMQERVHLLLGRRLINGHPTICTFHSLGVRILRESIHHLGYNATFTVYDEEDSNKLLRGCLQSLSVKKEAEFKTIRNYISHAKNQLQNPSEVDLSGLPHTFQQLFPEVYKLYQQRLKEANALDFDDLLFLTVRLFKEFPDILHAYQNRWPFLLIDEYQDTNRAQYLMARLIAGQRRNLFVVGDPDQSIYSWRGANIYNILNFEKDYPGAKIVRLEENYRSRKNILDAANKLIKNNLSRYEKNLWSKKGEGEKITLYVGGNEREEAGFVIHEIERLHTFQQIPFSEMTIFYRTNFQSRIFEDFLLRRGIPYTIVGGISFYQRKEIKDILAFLRMVNSDYDFISFERTINLPKRGIGLTTIEKIRSSAAQAGAPVLGYCKQLIDSEKGEIRLTAAQKEGLKDYIALIENLRALQKEATLKDLVVETVRQSGYLAVLREDKETFEDRKANVDELISKAHEWEMLNDTTSLDAFLEELSLKSSLDEAHFGKDKINLMTLHNGKGLEYDTAFLVGMEEDLFPHVNARDSHEAIEEERRLCYVGMTRAKERLYLTAAQSRVIWGMQRMMRPSRFLREIPREYIDRHR